MSNLRFLNQKDTRMSFYRSRLANVDSMIVRELLYSFRTKISIEYFHVIRWSIDFMSYSTSATYWSLPR